MPKTTSPMKRLAIPLVVLVTLASGCGDDAEPDEEPTVEPASVAVEEEPDSSAAVDEPAAVAEGAAVDEDGAADGSGEAAAQTEPATSGEDPPATTEAPADEDDAVAPALSSEPIRLGAISTLTGPASFPESHSAAQAVFDRVNAAGGIGGRMISYIVEDDGFDPALAAQAARRLADEEGVVAMVGSASLLECAVNAGFYAEVGLYSIQGTGIDPVCFATSNISPVNTGPFFSDTVALFYASEELGATNVCFGAFNVPDFQPAYDAAIAEWAAATGKQLAYSDTTLIFDGDLTPFMLELDSNGCDAAVVQANDFHYAAMMQIREAQGLDVQIIGLTSGYTAALAEQLGATGNGLVLASEFEPFTDTDSAAC